jgi:beta-glucosidase
MLAFYDQQLNLILEAGKIKLMIGSSSADIRLQDEFEITGSSETMLGQRLFICPVSIQ